MIRHELNQIAVVHVVNSGQITMTAPYNDALRSHTIDRSDKYKLDDDLTTTAPYNSEPFGDLDFSPTEHLEVTANSLSFQTARTDANGANVNPLVNLSVDSSVNSLCTVAEQSNGAVEHLDSLPISMASNELTLKFSSTNTPVIDIGQAQLQSASLKADRPIATQSIETASALIFPPDQRVPVTQLSPPFSAVGQMTSRWKGADGILNTGDDIVTFGSGAMVNRYHFLTAGHCIYEKNYGGWADRVEVRLPGGAVAFNANLRTYTGWIRDQNVKYDLGLVTLDRNIGDQTGWLGYGYNNAIKAGMSFNSTGYPSDKFDTNGDGIRDNFNVWTQYGKITQAKALTLRSTDLDVAKGTSGGPLWRFKNGSPTIYGVTSNMTGNLYNEFTRINGDRFNDIKRWIKDDTAQRSLRTASSLKKDVVASTGVAVGQFEDDVLTGGAKTLRHSLTDRSFTQTAAQSVHNMVQTITSTIEADSLRGAIAVPSDVSGLEPVWNSNHPFPLAAQT